MMNEVGITDLHYCDDCCDGSICSLRSLVSSDFNCKKDNDCLIVETTLSNNNKDDDIRDPGVVDGESFTRLTTTGCQQPHHPGASQRSINTEMTIIASTSPEIKMLGSFPVTPSFPNEINFLSWHRRQSSLDSLCSVESDSVASIVERIFLSPMRTDEDEDDDGCRHRLQDNAVVTPLDRNDGKAEESTTAFMEEEEADALCVVLNKQSLSGEDAEDRRDHNVHSNQNSSSCTNSCDQQTMTPRGHGRRHMTSPFMDRLTLHRRVSFSSLPSPAEIAFPAGQVGSRRPAHCPYTPRRAASCNAIGSTYSPSNNNIGNSMDLTS